jgi:hypothetical protein
LGRLPENFHLKGIRLPQHVYTQKRDRSVLMEATLSRTGWLPVDQKKTRQAPARLGEAKTPTLQLKEIERQLDYAHNRFNNATDPTLIDSYIYEIMSLNMKHKYFAKICKETGAAARGR